MQTDVLGCYSFTAKVNILVECNNYKQIFNSEKLDDDTDNDVDIQEVLSYVEGMVLSYKLTLKDFLELYRKESKLGYHVVNVINYVVEKYMLRAILGYLVGRSIGCILLGVSSDIGLEICFCLLAVLLILNVYIMNMLLRDYRYVKSLGVLYADKTQTHDIGVLIAKYSLDKEVDEKVLKDLIYYLGYDN